MLKARVFTALVLVAGLGSVLFLLPPTGVAVAFSLVAALAAWEWGGLMKRSQATRIAFAMLTLAACGPLYTVSQGIAAWLLVVSAAFWCFAAPLWLWRKWSLREHLVTGFVVGAVLILATWSALLVLQSSDPWLLLAAMALVWVADIGAYFAGRAFGRRKLAPSISPGKTWEGAAGGLIGVLVYAFIVIRHTALGDGLRLAYPAIVGIVVVLVSLSIVGDLFESLLKRQSQIKDSSNLLPGHGGILDRIDSLTSTLPVSALLLLYLK